MRLGVRISLICHALMLWSCSPAARDPSLPARLNQAAAAIEPKVVAQFAHGVAVIGVQWIEQGRVLVSLAGDGSLVFWDAVNGHIIDHAQIPQFDPDWLLQDFRAAPDGHSLEMLFFPSKETGDGPGPADCVGAHPSDGKWCTYRLELATREVRPDPGIAVPAADVEDPYASQKRIFPTSPDGTLQPRPNSRDGEPGNLDLADENLQFDQADCVSRYRCRAGVTLYPVQGGTPIKLVGDPLSFFSDADISFDGRKLVRVEGLHNETMTRVESMDLTTGGGLSAFIAARPYQQVSWLGDGRAALYSSGYAATNDVAQGGFPPAMIADPACSKVARCPTLPSYWHMQPLDDAGSFIAAGNLAGCFGPAGVQSVSLQDSPSCPGAGDEHSNLPFADALSVHRAGKPGWQAIDEPAWKGQAITAIRLSPDRATLAVATRRWDDFGEATARQHLAAWIVPIENGVPGTPRQIAAIDHAADAMISIVQGYLTDSGTILDLRFTPDSRHLLFSQFPNTLEMIGDLYDYRLGDGALRKLPDARGPAIPIGNDRVLDLGSQQLRDIATGAAIGSPLPGRRAFRAGWIERSKLFWTASDDGTIRLRDTADASLQLTLYVFPGNRFFAATPGGRYDTNMGPDTSLVRWMVPDAPFQSLAAQTFMRDFYEPGLYGKLLDCREAGTCADIFRSLPSIQSLARVLPQVRIADVKPGKDASEALVTVEVRAGEDPRAANGKTRSGIFNPRLFRNGRVVTMTPDRADADGESIETWRRLNDVSGAGGSNIWRFTYTVALPTSAGSERQTFSAYAFNQDRIKSETASFDYVRPPVAPRPPQAYVVTIGIDDYDTPRFKLNYSVADARLIALRLTAIQGYQVHRLTLAGERTPDGRRSRVDRAIIGQVLSLLDGAGDRARTLAALAATGIDASMLRAATPDDLVIVSFSGHGWADPRGNFFLIPTNGHWPDGARTPDLATVVATADLTRHFRSMSAGDISLIIDACHSAASVADGRFKPGPMGDSGLGQLAYDKGIRILAASQADGVAMEDARLKQGMLTYALAAEGLNATGGMADLDQDGRIGLTEWLTFAVQRMPVLAGDVQAGTVGERRQGAREIIFGDLPANAPKPRIQQPSLFDFNAATSPVVLRRIGR